MSEVKPFYKYDAPHNLDFDPHEVVGKYPNPLLLGVKRFAVVTALTAGAITGLATIYDIGDAGALNREREELADEQATHTRVLERRTDDAIDADGNLDQISVDLGEGCVALVQTYMEGGALAGTPEDSIVSDITTNENQPCGDSQTEVRTSIRSLVTAQSAVTNAMAKLDEEQSVVIDDDLSGFESDAENQEAHKGLIVGTALGLLIGIPSGKSRYNKTSNKSWFAKDRIYEYLKPRIAAKNGSYMSSYVQADAWECSTKIVEAKMPELGRKA